MNEFAKVLLSAPVATLFILAGLIFLLISVVGNVAGKIEPGKTGRVAAGGIGMFLLVAGLYMGTQSPLSPSAPKQAVVDDSQRAAEAKAMEEKARQQEEAKAMARREAEATAKAEADRREAEARAREKEIKKLAEAQAREDRAQRARDEAIRREAEAKVREELARKEAEEKAAAEAAQRAKAEERSRALRERKLAASLSGDSLYGEVIANFDKYASGRIQIKAPDFAENGAIVPVEVKVGDEGPGLIWIFVESNTRPTAASIRYYSSLDNYFGARVKMARSGDVIVVFKSDSGRIIASRKSVNVKVGANPSSGGGPSFDAVTSKTRISGQVAKLLLQSPMTEDAYIRSVLAYTEGKLFAAIQASPLLSRNPYFAFSVPPGASGIEFRIVGSDGKRETIR